MEKNREERADERGGALSPVEEGGAVTEKKTEAGGDTGGGSRGEGVTLRPRGRDPRRAALFTAVLLLLAAVLVITVLTGRGSGEGSESDGETETAEPVGTEPPETEGGVYLYDPSAIPEGHVGIRPVDLSGDAREIVNLTEETVDVAALLSPFSELQGESGTALSAPTVLILHTHASEAYADEGAISWDGTGEPFRSADPDAGTVAVGRALAAALNGMGIPTLHAEVMHDVAEGEISVIGAYARARETVRHYTAIYPSIRYVIDLHRDAVYDESGAILRAVTDSSGEAAAQVMAIVGGGGDTDRALALAVLFSEALNRDGGRIARSPTLKAETMLSSEEGIALTLEFGTAGNSLSEALRSVEAVARALSEMIGIDLRFYGGET